MLTKGRRTAENGGLLSQTQIFRFWLFLFSCSWTKGVDAAIYLDALFTEYSFGSVLYFDFVDTKWSRIDMILNGRVSLLPSLNLEEIFAEENAFYEAISNETTHNDTSSEYNRSFGCNYPDDDFELEQWKKSPKFVIAPLGSDPFEASMKNISHAAERMEADFVVLIVNKEATQWRQIFMFWWSHVFPGTNKSSDLSWGGNSTDPYFFMAVGPMQGEVLAELVREERESRRESDDWNYFFGVDDTRMMKGRDFTVRLSVYFTCLILLSKWLRNARQRHESSGYRGFTSYTRFTGEDLGMGEIQPAESVQDCPVCLETMTPGVQVRILPCRHVLHHDCISGWFEQGKYSCPMCKLDLTEHLEEQQRASRDLMLASHPRRRWRLWLFGRKIQHLSADNLMQDDDDEGDLELTEEPSSGVVV